MGNPYPMLTYPGDIADEVMEHAGEILGFDETYRPYKIIDTELTSATTSPAGCVYCGRRDEHTHVRFEYADGDDLRKHAESFKIQVQAEVSRRARWEREFMSHLGGGR